MLLVYTHITSPRLQYICNFIFKDLLGVNFIITVDSEEFKNHEGAKINYSDAAIPGHGLWIKNYTLLFEELIIPQRIVCFELNHTKAFFKTATADFPFDIFAASFYLLTRYEEYLPHEKDIYGRYAYENSLAFNEDFLKRPLINIWVKDLAEKLKEKYSVFNIQYSMFSFEPTYDIDIAYSYKHKGLGRNAGGFFKSPAIERIRVVLGSKKDPFDSYDWLDELHDQYHLQPVYFFLVAGKNGKYDKNILPHKDAMWNLVKRHAKKYPIGLHPSWQSGDASSLLQKEKVQLEAMCERGQTPITNSRQHYIRFNLPQGYQRIIDAGITHDYSMGYGSINGFRASVASSFYWYDLETEEQTSLRIHPFCFMDANSFYEQKQSAEETYDELLHYYTQCKTVGGTLITIWHNNFLGTDKMFEGWKEIYRRFIAQVQQ
jgi:hypothetical protein